jgi:hypothetical protein
MWINHKQLFSKLNRKPGIFVSTRVLEYWQNDRDPGIASRTYYSSSAQPCSLLIASLAVGTGHFRQGAAHAQLIHIRRYKCSRMWRRVSVSWCYLQLHGLMGPRWTPILLAAWRRMWWQICKRQGWGFGPWIEGRGTANWTTWLSSFQGFRISERVVQRPPPPPGGRQYVPWKRRETLFQHSSLTSHKTAAWQQAPRKRRLHSKQTSRLSANEGLRNAATLQF